MSRRLRLCGAAALLLLVDGVAPAAPPHACHGTQMFDAGGLPPEPLRKGVGTSEFPISSANAQARQMMRQGMALLHCFWHFEAYRSFLEVVRLDPNSPMGYWGLYLVFNNFNGYDAQAKEQLGKAIARMKNASAQEQYYLRASQALTEKKDRNGYLREMEALSERYPDDVDARLLLALETMSGHDADGNPREGLIYSQSLLSALLARHPDNVGVVHYLVHAFEGGPHPESVLQQAERLAQLAPASGHIVHMPGHIFYRLGDYARARQAFLDSMKVDEAYQTREKVKLADNWNYSHNLAYLVATCAEDGRYAEGQRLARKLDEVGNEPAAAKAAFGSVYTRAEAGDFALARLQMRYGDWAAAARNPLAFPIADSDVHEQVRRYRQGLRAYLTGMAALTGGHTDEAERQADALDAGLWQLQRISDDDAPKNVRRVLGLASYDLRANVLAQRGQLDAAVALLQKAERLEQEIGYAEPPPYWRPVDESLGQIYLRARKWDSARQAFARALERRPRNGFSLAGLGAAEAGAGHVAAANAAYRQLLVTWAGADVELPALREARAWLAAHDAAAAR